MLHSILIIEDDAVFRSSLAHFLDDQGFEVLQAEDATAAMHLFLHHRPDLVLLDLGIVGAEGMDVLKSMKKVRSTTPVMIVSGRTRIADAIEAFRAGAWDYVSKPIANMEVFVNAVRNCLAQTGLQQRVQETQEHLYRLIQNLPVIVFIINRNLEFEFLNQTTEEILGYSPQEIQVSPKFFLRRIVAEDRKKFITTLKNSLQSNAKEFRLEFHFQHKLGYQVCLQAQSIVYPRQMAGSPDRVEGMIRDVTRTTFMEKILVQNLKLSVLRAITEEVAHEIRNPLVSLGGFARKLRSKYPDALETEVILQECGRLEQLVQRVKSHLDPFKANLARCSVPEAMAFVLRLLSNRLERKDIICSVQIANDVPDVLADQEFLHRIFIYLIRYGTDIAEQSATIRIATRSSGKQVQVTLEVAPVHGHLPANLSSMPADDEERTLATCHQLSESIGGRLQMEREESSARFIVFIPAYDPIRTLT